MEIISISPRAFWCLNSLNCRSAKDPILHYVLKKAYCVQHTRNALYTNKPIVTWKLQFSEIYINY